MASICVACGSAFSPMLYFRTATKSLPCVVCLSFPWKPCMTKMPNTLLLYHYLPKASEEILDSSTRRSSVNASKYGQQKHRSKSAVHNKELETLVDEPNLQEPHASRSLVDDGVKDDSSIGPEGINMVSRNNWNEESDLLSSPREVVAAKIKALSLLGRGEQTAAELKKKLRKKMYSHSAIDTAILEIQNSGLQSDKSYAEIFTRSHWEGRSWGPKRIEEELKRKGVSSDNVHDAIVSVFHKESSEGMEETTWGISKSAQEQLLMQASKQWQRGGNISDETRKRRLIGWLGRRGFNWNVIGKVLKVVTSLELEHDVGQLEELGYGQVEEQG